MPVTIEEDYSDFDWDSTDDGQEFELLPDGWYPVRVVKVELKEVNGREGTFSKLAVRYQVLDGHEYAGRLVFDDILLGSKPTSRKRRAIIWRRLGLVQKGAQKAKVSGDDLTGIECAVQVKTKEFEWNGKKRKKNEIEFSGFMTLAEYAAEQAGEQAGEPAAPKEPETGAGEGQLSEEDVPF